MTNEDPLMEIMFGISPITTAYNSKMSLATDMIN